MNNQIFGRWFKRHAKRYGFVNPFFEFTRLLFWKVFDSLFSLSDW